jgi:AAA+ superfamily predicted ATPase
MGKNRDWTKDPDFVYIPDDEENDILARYGFTEKEGDRGNLTQWAVVGDGSFFASNPTVKELESGLYELIWHNKVSDWTFMRQTINTDELYELPTEEIDEILNDVKKFWKKSDMYKKHKLLHKRGILLYGDPGCGKSGILQLCMKHIVEDLKGIIINLKDEDSVKAYVETIPKFRNIEPNRPLVVIIEDIDAIAAENAYVNSMLLNILDGVKQIENVVYIATTNYPEKLEERITNRPSRFDRRYYIAPPSQEVRKAYLQNKGKDLDIDIEKWVKDTDSLSLSHLKELFISVCLLDCDYDHAIANLKGLKKTPRRKNQSSIGFSAE